MGTKIFWAEGSVTIFFDDEIEAENEIEAKEKYIQMVKDNYSLDTIGEMHTRYDVKIDVGEFDEE
jgi:hypothetical protein